MRIAIIIAIVLSLVAIAVGVVLIFRISSLFNEVAGLGQAIKDVEKQGVSIDGIPVSYSPKTNTVVVRGNLSSTGWIVSGGIKVED